MLVTASPLRKAVQAYFRESASSASGVSARSWWAANPAMLDGVREDIWLLRVLAEHENKGRDSGWGCKIVATRDPLFDGNVQIHDIVVSRRAA